MPNTTYAVRAASFLVFAALVGPTGPSPVRATEPASAPVMAPETAPALPDGTTEATRAIAGFKTPPGTKVELFAAEPQLGNPVAFCLDEKNRVFVAEQYRFNRGTEENRTRPFLLEDDLQIRTLDDRLAMFRKWESKFDGGMKWFSRYTDQIRLLEDRDGDGRAERSTVFATGFNDPLDGMAAGVLARDGDVYVTCIPHLWRLRDKDGDGKADERQSLQRGFGVNAAFLGHDLHGLTWGPDGKLYFSVGDRGFDLKTSDGRALSGPRVGAVFRCLPDGTQLEVVARGLRNPQEIAFDQYGNLFAADNNCDKGDHSRLVWIVEGGDSGWNMAYQTLAAPYLTGPWHAEKIWHLADPEQPAWLVPPVGKLGAGPSGFAYYPGTGLSARYDDHFFMCNYTSPGGVESFAVKPKGAGFEIVDPHDFWKPVQATDVEFGYDGKVYVSDYVKLEWNGGGGWGRIYALQDPQQRETAAVRQMTELFRDGFGRRTTVELGPLLTHPDLRVRQRAQFELARRGGAGEDVALRVLREAATTGARPTTRLHGLWGVAQIAAGTQKTSAPLREFVREKLADSDPHVRGQAAKLLGDLGASESTGALVARLADEDLQVRFHAANSLGKLAADEAFGPIVEMLRANADADPFLRHAAVMALVRCERTDVVERLGRDVSPAVRMAALLTARRRADPRVAQFLDDAELRIVTEAARAINDLPIDAATAKLATTAQRFRGAPQLVPEALWRRVINANYRVGGRDAADTLVALAGDARLSVAMRGEAMAALRQWDSPPSRDRVTGFWRPLASRANDVVKQSIEANVSQLLAGADGELQTRAAELVAALAIPVDDAYFAGWVADRQRAREARVAALRLLAGRKSPAGPAAIETALASDQPALRAAARELIALVDAPRAIGLLRGVLDDERASIEERQGALATLAKLREPGAESLLLEWTERLAAGRVAEELQLDVLEAAETRELPALRELVGRWSKGRQELGALGPHLIALRGGDAGRGRAIFEGHPAAQCMRCHRVGGQGGNAGPELTKVAQRENREHFLQSLVDPDAKIAPGFGTATLVLQDGRAVTGIIRKEDDGSITLETATGEISTIKKTDVEERTPARSPMPSPLKHLSRRDLRDLVEYLSTLR